jgi:L-cysteine S-thiosulfotransferase
VKRRRGALVVCAVVLASFAGSASAQQLNGEQLAFDRSKGNCLTCHAIAGGDAPGNVGPELSKMKERFPNRAELVAIVGDETKRNPLTVMPPFKRNMILSDQEIEAIVDFLYTR